MSFIQVSVSNTNSDLIEAAVAGLSLDHEIVENQNSFIPFTTIPLSLKSKWHTR
jgi:hypothetical protein